MRKLTLLFILLLLILSSGAAANPLQQAWDRAWKGDYKGAVKEYTSFAKANPNNPQSAVALYNAASIAMTQMGQTDEAGKLFAELVNKYPDTRWATEGHRRLSLIALEAKRPQEAMQHFRQALKSPRTKDYQMPDSWVAGLAQDWRNHLSELGEPSLAVDMYREVLQVMPPGESVAQTQYELADMLKTSGKASEAAVLLAEVLVCYPHTRWGGKALQEDHDLVLGNRPDFPWDDVQAMNSANALARAGNFAGADSIFSRVLAKHPGTPLAQNALFGKIGTDLYLTGDFEAATSQLQDFMAQYPKAYRLRDVERRLEYWGDIARMEASLKEDPQDYATHLAVGSNQLQMRFYSQAEEHFRAALADTTSDQALLGLGNTCLATGKTEEGAGYLEIYLGKHNNEGNVFNQVGYAYLGMGEMEKALKCFERYRDLEPNNANAHDSYAECLMNLDKLDKAAAEYHKAIEINPEFTNPYFMLGEVHARKNDIPTALEFYKKYLTLDPTGFQSEQAQAAVDSLSVIRKP